MQEFESMQCEMMCKTDVWLNFLNESRNYMDDVAKIWMTLLKEIWH